ncbi:GDP-mannose 4,6-dehydratase [bacterium]|nr:GDP-mannose 4,6-dehydratase [candidate division CSSED10-310 bacterium]
MNKYLVTGVAGFIGSHLAEALLRSGGAVRGIDCFTDYYPRWIKERNLAGCLRQERFSFTEADLLECDLHELVDDADVVFHLAAQAGVRASWGESFKIYTNNNILATQLLLEAVRSRPLRKLVYASSSSVYGDTRELPMNEAHPVLPVSPYGVSKLSGEQLGMLYHHNFGVPVVGLRFFTVYGPRQRPDMGFHRFFAAIHEDRPITIFGDGEQTRDFTYIEDIVRATVRASEIDESGLIFNIGGGHRVTVNEVMELLAKVTGRTVEVTHIEDQKGDMRHTYADISRAARLLAYHPQYELERGLRQEWDWYRTLRSER